MQLRQFRLKYFSILAFFAERHGEINCPFSINLAQLWRMDESKGIKIFGSRWSGLVDNKNGPWKFGDKMWSFSEFISTNLFPIILSRN